VATQKPREIAARVLGLAERSPLFLDEIFERSLRALPRISGADKALARELTFGVTRWKATLDWLISRKTRYETRLSALQNLLRLGLYQIFWLTKIPDHAAVFETVALAKQLGLQKQASFLNGLLRSYLRERQETIHALEQLKQDDLALGYSHPEWLVNRWLENHSRAQVEELLRWNNTPPKTYARLNALCGTAHELEQLWESEGVHFLRLEFPWAPRFIIFELTEFPLFDELGSFKTGRFYLQDPSTLAAPSLAQPLPEETVLDVCAAPGGKTTALAELMRGQGLVQASDLSPKRLKLLRENITRLRLPNVTVLNAGEALRAASNADCVILDVPCSNTGVMRRRVDLRWKIQPEELTRLQGTQWELLVANARALKPGARLIYSTCSLEPEENAQLIQKFLTANPRFELQHQIKITPTEHQVDGAYVAVLRKPKK